MVNFTSLFLGLVLGAQTVQVAVDDSVARVEIHLDGRMVSSAEGPPWRVRCDLGDELAPHHLEAIAFDGSDRELGRASQWINVPRQPAEITIVLEGGEGGKGRIARVSWESLAGGEPSAVKVSFDGIDLAVRDPRRVELPAHDPTRLHFLQVELEFAGFLTSVGEVTFGGVYADTVHSELTAVPILVESRREMPRVAALDGRFAAGGEPVDVVAVDKGPPEIVAVLDRSSFEPLRAIRSLALADRTRRTRWFRQSGSARDHWTVQFLAPVARQRPGFERPYDLFPLSIRYSGRERSLQGWVSSVGLDPEASGRQRLADAVTVAGIQAAAGNRRRAVLLVLGESPEDHSGITPGQARRFLERLRVPLMVWSTAPDSTPTPAAWGEVLSVSSAPRLERATERLRKLLERQRIVWLGGTHLPHHITFDPGLDDILLLGATEP